MNRFRNLPDMRANTYSPFPVHFLTLTDQSLKIAYTDEGRGDHTLLFVHGLGNSALGWTKCIAALKDDFRCVAIDLPGNGQSSAADTYGMKFFAECLRAFIDKARLKNVYLCGHSMGGQIGLTHAHYFPDQLKGLILCASAGLETFTTWEKSLYQSTVLFMDLVADEERSLRNTLENSFYAMPEGGQWLIGQFIAQMKLQDRRDYRRMLEQCIKGMLYEPVEPWFSEIRMPVHLIFGENDGLIPNRFIHPGSTTALVHQSARKFPDAGVTMIPHCGHFLQWEHPQKVTQAITEFITAAQVSC